MIYTIENSSIDKEKQWTDFEKTGSVFSYLEYKGIYLQQNSEHTEEDSAEI